MEKSKLKFGLSIISGLILIGIVLYLCDIENLRNFKNFNVIPMTISCVLAIAMTFTLIVRWEILINVISNKKRLNYFPLFHFMTAIQLLIYILPKEIVELGGRTFYLNKNYQVPLIQASLSVVWDRLFDVWVTLTFFLGSLPFWLNSVKLTNGSIVKLFFISPVIGILVLAYLNEYVEYLILKIKLCIRYVCQRYEIKDYSMYIPDIPKLEMKILFMLYGVSVLKFFLLISQYIMFLLTLGSKISPFLILMGTPASQLTFIVSFSPGGLGFLEAGWFSILTLNDVDKEQIAIFIG